MFAGVLGKVTGILDPRTVLVALLPTLAFWAGVAGLAGTQVGWHSTQHWWTGQNSFSQVVLAVVAVAGLVVLALVLAAAEGRILPVYEGYWSDDGLVGRLRTRGISRQNARRAALNIDEDRADFEYRYRHFPVGAGEEDLLPTRLGNILKAAEVYPAHEGRYQLDAVFWWPRLIAVVPDSARADLSSARASIGLLLNVCSLSAVFAAGALLAAIGLEAAGVGTFWGFWAAAGAAALIALVAQRAVLGPALLYADLLRSAFDLYRLDLLKKLGFALPETLAAERELWTHLGEVLYRGATSEAGEAALDAARKSFMSAPPPT